jgi:hypothetical protein
MNILDNSILNRIPEYCGEGHDLSESDEAMMLYLLLGKYNFMCDDGHPDPDRIVRPSSLYNLLHARLVEIAGKEATEELYEGFHWIHEVLKNKLAQSTPLDCAEVGEDTGDCDSLYSDTEPDNDVACSDDWRDIRAAYRDYEITSDGNAWLIVYSDEDNCTHDYFDYVTLEEAEEDLVEIQRYNQKLIACQGGE